jgi:hypothetical protein
MSFPNDYVGVHAALTAGKHVEAASPLGSRYRELAEGMAGKKPGPIEKKRGFMDLLSRPKKEVEVS